MFDLFESNVMAVSVEIPCFNMKIEIFWLENAFLKDRAFFCYIFIINYFKNSTNKKHSPMESLLEIWLVAYPIID